MERATGRYRLPIGRQWFRQRLQCNRHGHDDGALEESVVHPKLSSDSLYVGGGCLHRGLSHFFLANAALYGILQPGRTSSGQTGAWGLLLLVLLSQKNRPIGIITSSNNKKTIKWKIYLKKKREEEILHTAVWWHFFLWLFRGFFSFILLIILILLS